MKIELFEVGEIREKVKEDGEAIGELVSTHKLLRVGASHTKPAIRVSASRTEKKASLITDLTHLISRKSLIRSTPSPRLHRLHSLYIYVELTQGHDSPKALTRSS